MTKSEVGSALSKILLEGVDVHRCAAARALGRIADPGAADALKQALLDEDPDVRVDAVDALGAAGAAGIAEALMENLLHDPDCEVKKAAIATLIRLRHQPLVRVLHGLVVSRGDDIVWDEDELYSEGWDSWLDIQLMAIKGLGEFGAEEAVADIVAALDDEMGQDVSETAINALARLGRPGAEALSALFARGDDRYRRRIADAAGAGANPHLDHLRDRCLGDRSAHVRLAAAIGLAQDNPADPRLRPLLEDGDANIRATLVSRVGSRFPALVEARFDDPSPAVRSAAFGVVARHPDLFGEDGSAGTVRAAISGDPGVATQAALAWVALVGEAALPALGATVGNSEVPAAFRIGAIGSLRQIGRSSVPYLLAVAGDGNRQLRLGALTALADFAATDPVWPNSAGDGLLAALGGDLVPEPEEVPEDEPQSGAAGRETDYDAVAADAQAELENTPLAGEPRATSTLDAIVSGPSGAAADAADGEAPTDPVELSEQEARLLALSEQRAISKKKVAPDVTVAAHQDVRRFAAKLLGGVGHPDVTARLIASLAQDDEELRHAALQSLVEHGERSGTLPGTALKPLTDCIAGGSPDLRLLAVRALGWLDAEEIGPILRGLLSDPDLHIRLEAVRALDLRGVADGPVLACLKDGYSGVRLAAASALARHRGPEIVGPLVEFALADDGMYRRDVGRILGEFAREPATGMFLEILDDDTRKRHWLVAIEALAEMFQQSEPPEELKVA